MPHKLPPLNALRIFVVAVRAGSYSAAARELHLTHGAVSRQIDILEDWLGQPLFVRKGQRMMPTSHAEAFGREICSAFDHISLSSERYGKVATRKVLRVNVPATFAMRWLIPRLSVYRELEPDVDIRVDTAFSAESGLRRNYDIAIRRSPSPGENFTVLPLFTEWQTVVATPALVQEKNVKRVSDLANGVLLSTETRPGSWETWLQNADHAMLRAAHAMRFDHFFVTMQAVIDSLGFAIGPFPTLDRLKASGRIITPFDEIRTRGDTYSLWIPHDADKSVSLRAFVDWVMKEAEASRG